jgi:Fe-S cluster assembly protein SufD
MTSIKEQFQKSNLIAPSKKDEDWLYYNLESLLDEQFKNETQSNSSMVIDENYFLHFINGELINHSLPEECVLSETDIIPKKTNNSFITFALEQSKNYHLDLLKSINEPIAIIYENSNGYLSTTALQIRSRRNIKNHIKRYFSAPENTCLTTYANCILEDHAELTITETNTNNQGRILDFIDAELNEKCLFFTLNQSYLSQNSRFQNRVFVNGEYSNATLHGLAINEVEQECYYNTHIFHDCENSESHQLFKSMVKKNALLEYNGKVTVCPNAQQTNSYQLNQNILLDDFANVYSRPQLFIDADDVKCTHGSTTGDINEHEVLYLMSRGLDRLTSRKIVLNAFFEEVFNKTEFKSEQQDIHSILNKIL